MLKRSITILLVACFSVPAQGGLFADDDARARIQQLEGRVVKLEEHTLKLEEAINRQTKLMLDLQGQIEALNVEINKLRGQNEELVHGLQNAEKREKDFYVDLDTRLRRFESADNATQTGEKLPATTTASSDPNDPAQENRAFELAYSLFKNGNYPNAIKAFQDFLKKYPNSAHVANTNYWIGNAQFLSKDFKNALSVYQRLIEISPDMPKVPEVLFNIAKCQQELKQTEAAQKTLKQLIAKYPASEAAAKAKKLQAISK